MSRATDGMEEIVKEFLAESAEGLDLLERDLVELERDPGSRERLDEMFRAVHTIKGSSGMLGYPRLESVAHAARACLADYATASWRRIRHLSADCLRWWMRYGRC